MLPWNVQSEDWNFSTSSRPGGQVNSPLKKEKSREWSYIFIFLKKDLCIPSDAQTLDQFNNTMFYPLVSLLSLFIHEQTLFFTEYIHIDIV